jgi:ATP-binding cassette subfamily A (ABC1) protein 3
MEYKNKFGVGYNLTIVKSGVSKDSRTIIEVIITTIPTANILGDAGMEISFQIPSSDSSSFSGLFGY